MLSLFPLGVNTMQQPTLHSLMCVNPIPSVRVPPTLNLSCEIFLNECHYLILAGFLTIFTVAVLVLGLL